MVEADAKMIATGGEEEKKGSDTDNESDMGSDDYDDSEDNPENANYDFFFDVPSQAFPGCEYKPKEKLHLGALGALFVVKLEKTEEAKEDAKEGIFVMKVIPNTYLKDKEATQKEYGIRNTQVDHEIYSLQNADPRWCNRMVEVIDDFAEHRIMVVEYCPGFNLADFRYFHCKHLSENQLRDICWKIAKGIESCGEGDMNIIHRDIHQANVMIYFDEAMWTEEDLADVRKYHTKTMPRKFKEAFAESTHKNLRIKLIDFGLCKKFESGAERKHRREGVGDEKISAPEAEQYDKYETGHDEFDHRTDVWGLGAMFYFLATETLMFFTHHELGQPERVAKDQWSIQLWHQEDNFNIHTYSLELLNFINDLVKLDYEDRPTIKEVLEHRYWKTDLKSVKSVQEVANMLKPDPEKDPLPKFDCFVENYDDFACFSTIKEEDKFQKFYEANKGDPKELPAHYQDMDEL